MAQPSYVGSPELWSELWTMTDTDSELLLKRLLFEKLDKITLESGGILNKFKKLGSISDIKPRWVREIDYPREIVGTLSGSGTAFTVTGNLFNTAITRTNLLKVCRVGTILKHTASGTDYTCQVSAIHGSNPVLTVGVVNSGSMPADGASQTWRIITEPWTDAGDVSGSRSLNQDIDFCTSEIFMEVFEILKTRRNMRQVIVGTEEERQMDALLRKLNRQIAAALIEQVPVISGGVAQSMLEVAEPRLCGLDWWVSKFFGSGGSWENADIYKNLGAAQLDKTNLDDLAAAMYDIGVDFESGSWGILTTPRIKQYMNDYGQTERILQADDKKYGYLVDRIMLKIGKEVPIDADRCIPPGRAYLINYDNCQYGFFTGDEISRKEMPTSSRSWKWMISGQVVGMVVRKAPQSISCIYNIAEE